LLLEDFFEKEKKIESEIIEIFASGPSVSISKKLKVKSLKIAVGDMPWRARNLGPYGIWITNNTYFPLPWKKRDLKIIRKSRAITFISSQSVNRSYGSTEKYEIFRNLSKLKSNKNIIFYDCFHFQFSKEKHKLDNCCDFVNQFDITQSLQNYFADFTGIKIGVEDYKIGHGTTNAILLALLLKCKIIYLHGVELPETMGNYTHYKNWKMPVKNFKLRLIIYYQQIAKRNLKTDFSNETRNILLKEFRVLGRIANEMGTKIYVTNKNSPLLGLTNYDFLDLD
jgi:hypothetical protein